MSDFALYRLPGEKAYHSVAGVAETLASIGDLKGRTGFVFAPFDIGGGCPLLLIPAVGAETGDVPAAAAGSPGAPQVVSEDAHREAYRRDFGKLHGRLADGSVEKVVLSRRLDLTMREAVDPREAFFKACRMYPQQMIVLASTGRGGTWLMATPEVLLERGSADGGYWKTMALAGTMTAPGPWSEKNVKEQCMVANYIINRVGRYAYLTKYSSPYTVTAARLYHLRTDISFLLSDDGDVLRVLSSLHPTPAVCGLPKDRAFGLIRDDESFDRKYYSGFSGPLGLAGETHLFVSLRCMEMAGRECHLYAGGGLLGESTEASEWQETEDKLKTMADVLN